MYYSSNYHRYKLFDHPKFYNIQSKYRQYYDSDSYLLQYVKYQLDSFTHFHIFIPNFLYVGPTFVLVLV